MFVPDKDFVHSFAIQACDKAGVARITLSTSSRDALKALIDGAVSDKAVHTIEISEVYTRKEA